ncbi:MAG: DMT family transporter [Candidatus Thermoplasmatota archaeon]|nr:DMT family transporter [Candidatus Thermoplasmatota archaeon]MCL6090100.1 DMT family transporter [Candidatus Thermoplasmatota archaeon]
MNFIETHETEIKKRTASQIILKFKGYTLLVFLSIIWGLAFVAIREAVLVLTPINLTLLRWIIASAGFLVILPFIKAKMKFERKDIPKLLVMSLTNVAGYNIALNYAETSISAGLAALLISFGPVFITLLSAVTLKERIGIRIGLALLLAIIGTLFLSFTSIGPGYTGILGPVEVILAAVSYAIFTVVSKPLVHKYGALPVTIWMALAGTVMIIPLISPSFIYQVEVLPTIGWISVIYLAILSTVLGYSLFYVLVGRNLVSKLSVQLYIVPVVSVIGGAILLKEDVTAFTILGGAFLLAAVGLTTMKKKGDSGYSFQIRKNV